MTNNPSIVYEDADMLAINKPAGISVHKTHPADPHRTIADILVERYPAIRSVGEDPLRPGIVHRLDKETSGIMLVAKTQEAFRFLKNQFQERTIQKHYLALVHGAPASARGTIDAPLGKLGTKQTTQIKGKQDLVEREAITDYAVQKRFQNYTLLDVFPHTGRTHQIRVHLKSIGCPIVGDTLYGQRGGNMPEDLRRMFLHAQSIQFTAPSGQRITLEVDLPEDLQKVLAMLQ